MHRRCVMFAEKLKNVSQRMSVAGDEIPAEASRDIAAIGMSIQCLQVAMAASCRGLREATFTAQRFKPEVDKAVADKADAACEILRADGIGCRVVQRQGRDVATSADPDHWEVVVEMTW